MKKQTSAPSPTFIDLFSGCGGLSLGLCQAGWQGLFAVERATDAFETFRANFLDASSRYRFQWPEWLDQRAHLIDEVLDNHRNQLQDLSGRVDLIAGGPPCQGFSFAGKRNGDDPRNMMFERYVSFVDIIKPKFLILENVPGMDVAHASARRKSSKEGVETYYERLVAALNKLGYVVSRDVLDASKYGVPQRRPRLVVVGIKGDIASKLETGCTGVFTAIEAAGARQLAELGDGRPMSAADAISDLVVGTGRTKAGKTIEYTGDGARRGYLQLRYSGPTTTYQRVMHDDVAIDQMDSMRLAHHRPDVEDRFSKILKMKTCKRGVNLSQKVRDHFEMLKHRTVPMAAELPAPTLTTLPDDILHYEDPRILTVRESARLQSFPDWFVFKGKYTTGGERRRIECPRYTQVGNAVPPLLARAVGSAVLEALRAAQNKADGSKVTLIKRAEALAGR